MASVRADFVLTLITVADSPSGGSVTSCVFTMRPSSSTLSGTLAGVAGLRQHDVDDQRRALEDGARRLDARHLHVVREMLLADADREDRNRSRLQARQRFVDRGVGRVGAVGHHDEPGKRQAGELVARAVERLADPRRRAAELQVRGRRDAIGRRREAEEADDEPLRERVEQLRVRS